MTLLNPVALALGADDGAAVAAGVGEGAQRPVLAPGQQHASLAGGFGPLVAWGGGLVAAADAQPAAAKEVALNLLPYGVRGELLVPEGTKLRRNSNLTAWVLDAGPGFRFEVDTAEGPLAKTPIRGAIGNIFWVTTEQTLLSGKADTAKGTSMVFAVGVGGGDLTDRF